MAVEASPRPRSSLVRYEDEPGEDETREAERAQDIQHGRLNPGSRRS